ncbi:MAG TPA: preprotein translocase subunit SecA [Chloroflexota bacterium]|nr:preprotein translocase subunit SecA [Chloroflexota bacterium]
MAFLTRFTGDPNTKHVRKLQPEVDAINALETEYERLRDDQLRDKTTEFISRHLAGESLDKLLPEAFAAVREASKRTLGLRHYDVQMVGGIVLHQGKIAEMKTGEGKTLVATTALYLNALTGRGCHLVTVNDYLVRRDAGWMGQIFHALGMTTSAIAGDMSLMFDPEYVDEKATDDRLRHLRPITRQKAYQCHITYGTNSEFGFDYLRDNLAFDLAELVQRELYYAIVDEVDNILIDEARTPLIISGEAEESSEMYRTFARLAPQLRPETDYTIDEKARSVSLSEMGIAKVERMLGVQNMYDEQNFQLVNYLEQAVRAQVLYHRDKDYVVQDGEVIIVDEFTGRLMPGRRWSDGLHQAVEAKERVNIQRENVTHATITLQNYFRMYEKRAGMTGTAETEAEEFHKIYGLDVVAIPTNKPMIREDYADLVYRDQKAKFKAVAAEIKEKHERGQPVLVGTTSIEMNEQLSNLLTREGVPHKILNAKQHEKEAAIIAEAGQKGAVTVATNMAGRGVDIILGPGVTDLGGLAVIGTERHESRRIDNQLRGRSGRQGDPGESRFFVSLDDELMTRFVGPKVKGILERFGMSGDEALEHNLVSRTIESAQTKVEGFNFDYRKHLVEYDDVIRAQREIIYGERMAILRGEDVREIVMAQIAAEIDEMVDSFCPGNHSEEWDLETLCQNYTQLVVEPPSDFGPELLETMSREELSDYLFENAEIIYKEREQSVGEEIVRAIERNVLLQIISQGWVQHVDAMDELREAAQLHAFSQQDPLVVYKRKAFEMFDEFQAQVRRSLTHNIFHILFGPITITEEGEPPPAPQPAPQRPRLQAGSGANGGQPNGSKGKAAPNGRRPQPGRRNVAGASKIGRNDPCPCGSGKKYKLCHGGAGAAVPGPSA